MVFFFYFIISWFTKLSLEGVYIILKITDKIIIQNK